MTGSVASMGLALAVGRGDTHLARLAGPVPLVRGEDVALIGRRDQGQSYGHEALAISGILDLPWAAISPDGAAVPPTALADTASTALARVAATRAGSGSSSMPTCSAPRSCPPSGRPSPADRTSTSWPRCSRHWSTTRRRSAWRSRSTTPPSTRIDRPQPGWWSCSRNRFLVGDDMPRRLDIVGAQAAPARTHPARSGRHRPIEAPDCLLSFRSAASRSRTEATCPASVGGSTLSTCGP